MSTTILPSPLTGDAAHHVVGGAGQNNYKIFKWRILAMNGYITSYAPPNNK